MSNNQKKRVLIVEDEADLAVVFANLLDVFGFTSQIVDNGANAREIVNNEKFDLFIIDLTLPDISGIDLYRDIVSAYPAYKGQVIFTSGMNISDDLNQIIKDDNTSFLAKPFSMDKLKKVLDKWL
ncbi:MAG: response regulator [Calditrichaeota bacterium]|nr:response regulator [Calditrichota bacterium]RQW04673.1 MAG: response regulator [Calditrichota bacterium]